METPSTTSCFGIKRRRNRSRDVDRFSDLPYNVYDCIFSFLRMKEFIRLTVCSKRLRDICYSVQCLTFKSSKSNLQKKDEEFLSYSRFLIDRGDRNLRHLRIRWELGWNPYENIRDERFINCVNTWIQYAVRCKLGILHFQLTGERNLRSFSLPHCLFSCQTLKGMTIDLSGRRLNFPSSTGFINLGSLLLKGITISDEKSSANFLSCLASLRYLKHLWIENIDGIETIEVNSSYLETFGFVEVYTNKFYNLRICSESLQTLYLNWNSYKHSTKVSLEISAPNLKVFDWRGNLPDSCCLKRFTKLDVATVFLAHKKFDDSQNLFKAICSFSGTKHLDLWISLIEDLFKQGYLPIALDNAQNLTLRINKQLNFDRTSAIGSFLKGTSDLKTLQIKSYVDFVTNNVQRVDVKFWESQKLGFIHQLQMVEIELLNGVTDLELARFILKHAKELKKMVIFHSSSLPTIVLQEVNEFKIASSDRVVFKVK